MSNDLVTRSTFTNISVVAGSPAEMERAQQELIAWCDDRVEREKVDLADAEKNIQIAKLAKMRHQPWQRRALMSKGKMIFYRKIKAALLKGYYIVPPFPVQLFAIRTDRHGPRYGSTTSSWENFEQKPTTLAEGEGRYVSPVPEIWQSTGPEKNRAGELVPVTRYNPTAFREVDFPFSMVKPQVLEATRKALSEKLFDALGVLPAFRTSDPIVVGQITPPHRKSAPVTFFVAWWLNTEDL